MNTSFSPVNLSTVKTAAANAARRVSVTRADAEREAQFQDLLSDRKTHEASAGAERAASDDAVRLTAMRHLADARESAAEAADRVNPPSPPAGAVSVQQAMLTMPARADREAKKVEEGEPGGPVAGDTDTGRKADVPASDTASVAVSSPVDPHGPPVAIGEGPGGGRPPFVAPQGPPPINDDDPMPTGGIKAPHVNPQDLPTPRADGGATPTGGKPPLVAPHGPPTVATDDRPATPTTVAQDKPLVIRPHGPVGLTPAARTDVHPEKAEKKDATLQANPDPVQSSSVPQGSPDDRTVAASMPADRANPSAPPMPPGGMQKYEYTTTIPVRDDPRTEAPAQSEAPAFLVTTAAQAHLAVNPAADTAANPVSVAATNILTSQEANLAAYPAQTTTKGAGPLQDDSSQNTESEHLTSSALTDGTATAKRQENVTAYPSNLETATGRAPWSSPDADASGASGAPEDWSGDSLRGRAKDGDAARASAATASASNPTAAAAQTPFAVATPGASPSTGIIQVDRMEALLQAVQQTAEQARFDGTGQMELRVRLAGVADDVTVRVHLDANKQAQVSFQTGSPELRAALEQGWNDLMATTPTETETSPATVPDFPTANPAPADLYRDDRRAATPTAAPEPAASRWSGYA